MIKVNVGGLYGGCGTTHFCISLARWFKNNGYDNVLITDNQTTEDYILLANEYGVDEEKSEDLFTVKGISFYADKPTPRVYKGMDVCIGDFGVVDKDSSDFFLGDYIFIVSGSRVWQRGRECIYTFCDYAEEYAEIESVNFVFPFADKKAMDDLNSFVKDIKCKAFFPSYEENPIETTLLDMTSIFAVKEKGGLGTLTHLAKERLARAEAERARKALDKEKENNRITLPHKEQELNRIEEEKSKAYAESQRLEEEKLRIEREKQQIEEENKNALLDAERKMNEALRLKEEEKENAIKLAHTERDNALNKAQLDKEDALRQKELEKQRILDEAESQKAELEKRLNDTKENINELVRDKTKEALDKAEEEKRLEIERIEREKNIAIENAERERKQIEEEAERERNRIIRSSELKEEELRKTAELERQSLLEQQKKLEEEYSDREKSLLERQEELAREKEIEFYNARHDALTHLPNRKALDEEVSEFVEKGYYVISLDANNLKYTNDTFGHDKGDELICTIADNINKLFIRAYRTGGDEFVAISEDNPKDNLCKLDNILEEISDSDKDLIFEVASGYVKLGNTTFTESLKQSDSNMYEDKCRKKELRKEKNNEKFRKIEEFTANMVRNTEREFEAELKEKQEEARQKALQREIELRNQYEEEQKKILADDEIFGCPKEDTFEGRETETSKNMACIWWTDLVVGYKIKDEYKEIKAKIFPLKFRKAPSFLPVAIVITKGLQKEVYISKDKSNVDVPIDGLIFTMGATFTTEGELSAVCMPPDNVRIVQNTDEAHNGRYTPNGFGKSVIINGKEYRALPISKRMDGTYDTVITDLESGYAEIVKGTIKCDEGVYRFSVSETNEFLAIKE